MERDQERGKAHTHIHVSLSLSLSYIVVVLSGVRQCGEGIKNCEGPLDQSYLWTKCKERERHRDTLLGWWSTALGSLGQLIGLRVTATG